MTYQEAIADYDSKSDEDKIILLYALYGRAMYRAQVLEQQAVNMLVVDKIFKNPPKNHEEYMTIWDQYDYSKNTLGAKAKEINAVYALSEPDSIAFNRVITLRNHLTHNYFRFNDNLFYSDAGKKQMIKDFIDFIDLSETVDDRLMSYMEHYNEKAGLTNARMEELLRRAKKEWGEKEIDETYDYMSKNNY